MSESGWRTIIWDAPMKESQSGSLMRTAEFVHLCEEDYDSHEENGSVNELLGGGVRSPCKKEQTEMNL